MTVVLLHDHPAEGLHPSRHGRGKAVQHAQGTVGLILHPRLPVAVGGITTAAAISAGGESGFLAPDPRDSNIVYGGTESGDVTRMDRRTRTAQVVSPVPIDRGSR